MKNVITVELIKKIKKSFCTFLVEGNALVVEPWAGALLQTTMIEAHKLTDFFDEVIIDDFNGRKISLTKESKPEDLMKEFSDSFTMGWTIIGPVAREYTEELKQELANKKQVAKEKAAEQAEQVRKERELAKEECYILMGETQFKVKPELQEQWDQWKSKNTDVYRARTIKYAEEVGILRQNGVEDAESIADYDGISGFMHSAAMKALKHFHDFNTSIEE